MLKMRESCKCLDVEGKDPLLKKERANVIDGARPELQCMGQWVNLERGRAFEEAWQQESDLVGNNVSTLLYSSFLDQFLKTWLCISADQGLCLQPLEIQALI